MSPTLLDVTCPVCLETFQAHINELVRNPEPLCRKCEEYLESVQDQVLEPDYEHHVAGVS